MIKEGDIEEDDCADGATPNDNGQNKAIEMLTAQLVAALHTGIVIKEEEILPQDSSVLDLHGMSLVHYNNTTLFQLFYSLSSEHETIKQINLDSNGFGAVSLEDTSSLVKIARKLTSFVNLNHISLRKNNLISLPLDRSVDFPKSHYPNPVLNSLVHVCRILSQCPHLETLDLSENNLKLKHKKKIESIFREEGIIIKLII